MLERSSHPQTARACMRAVFALPAMGSLLVSPARAQDVTYANDVAPILWEHCVTCHREGGVAPMSLLSYEDARSYAPLIKPKIVSREMPPWHMDRSMGIQDFKNDPSLSDDEIATIVRWVDAGAPSGDLATLVQPELQAWADTWRLEDEFGRPPDLVLPSIPHAVPPTGQDQWPNQWTLVEGLTQPRWARAVEIKPADAQSRYVFHHMNVRSRTPEGRSQLLSHSNVGKWYDIYPEDTGRLIYPGEELLWDMHFFPLGDREVEAQALLGVWLYPPGYEPELGSGVEEIFYIDTELPNLTDKLRGQEVMIPPDGYMTLQGYHVLDRPLRIHSTQIHMHQRGKSMTLEALYPDGRRELLNRLLHDHRWLATYVYEDHARPLLPKGTVLILTAQWDNTTENPNNPDPNQWVFFGRRTVDEMSHMWIGTTWLDDEQYERMVLEREQLLKEREMARTVGDGG